MRRAILATMVAIPALLLAQGAGPGGEGTGSPREGARRQVEYHLIPSVTIDDRSTIDFFVEEFFLPETSYTRIEVIDTESNGFGKNDLLKFHPSGSMYYLDMVTDTAQKVMNAWEVEENVEIVTDRLDPARYDSVGTAEFGILGSLAEGIERNYRGAPININMRRDSTGIVFEMWGYEADSLVYTPPPPPVPDSVPVFDLIQSYRTEETILPDTTTYDLLFIYRTETDTVFLEPPEGDGF